jgi:hypothetical protein
MSLKEYAESVRYAAQTPMPLGDLLRGKEAPSTGLIQDDAVNHPSHYTQGDIECIDAIKAALGEEGFKAYCRGACLKYLWRTEHKNGVEDLRKCAWYLNKLIQESI